MKQYNKPRKSCALFGLGFMEMILSARLGFLRGVFLANHLASNDNLAIAYLISDNVYNWIVNFLYDRKHQTKTKDSISDFKSINASIIQGSGLGP